jgi:hypothetical protein
MHAQLALTRASIMHNKQRRGELMVHQWKSLKAQAASCYLRQLDLQRQTPVGIREAPQAVLLVKRAHTTLTLET